MRAIAYNIQPHEKELLTLANGKRHELTLISNELNDQTVLFAQGKDVVMVATAAVLSPAMLGVLKRAGVRKVIVRSAASLEQSGLSEEDLAGLQVFNTPVAAGSPADIARKTIEYLHCWESEKGDEQSTASREHDPSLVSAKQCKRRNP